MAPGVVPQRGEMAPCRNGTGVPFRCYRFDDTGPCGFGVRILQGKQSAGAYLVSGYALAMLLNVFLSAFTGHAGIVPLHARHGDCDYLDFTGYICIDPILSC